MKTNMLFLAPNPEDATSFYRAYGPFGALRRDLPDVDIVTGATKITWAILNMVDIVFMQRAYDSSHVQVAEMAKDAKCKVWLDYDDDLFSVPIENPAYPLYSKKEVQKSIAKVIAMADIITVSTPFLKHRLERLNKNIRVIPNALNDFILDEIKLNPFYDRPKIVNWRGSKTHQRDILAYAGDILDVDLNKRSKSWKWHWIGDNPWFLTEKLGKNKCLISEGIDIIQYHRFIEKLQPRVQLVPLADNIFNHSKSNIAWIEATWCGALTICPNWEEWKLNGTIRYDEENSMASCLLKAMEMKEKEFKEMLEESRVELNKNFLLSKVNKIRKDIIGELS